MWIVIAKDLTWSNIIERIKKSLQNTEESLKKSILTTTKITQETKRIRHKKEKTHESGGLYNTGQIITCTKLLQKMKITSTNNLNS